MSAGAEHIYMTFIDIDRYLTKRLYGVRVKQNSFFMSDRADLFYRLYRTDLIVRKMTEINIVSGLIAASTDFGSTTPYSSTSR